MFAEQQAALDRRVRLAARRRSLRLARAGLVAHDDLTRHHLGAEGRRLSRGRGRLGLGGGDRRNGQRSKGQQSDKGTKRRTTWHGGVSQSARASRENLVRSQRTPSSCISPLSWTDVWPGVPLRHESFRGTLGRSRLPCCAARLGERRPRARGRGVDAGHDPVIGRGPAARRHPAAQAHRRRVRKTPVIVSIGPYFNH